MRHDVVEQAVELEQALLDEREAHLQEEGEEGGGGGGGEGRRSWEVVEGVADVTRHHSAAAPEVWEDF